MGLEEWLQSGKWAGKGSGGGESASKALEKIGSLFEQGRRTAGKAKQASKQRLEEATEKYHLNERVDAAKERAEAVREKATTAAEQALRFVKERPAARLARAAVQVKAGLTGFGAGYLFPDLEVLFLGVAGRGRWVVQSGVPVWGTERLAKYLLVDKPAASRDEEAARKWEARRELHRAVAAPMLCGFSTGLGVRLVQDAINVRNVPNGRSILVGDRVMLWERAWMLGNGIWCFAMGKDLLMVTLGRTKSPSVSEMLRKLNEGQVSETEEEEGID
ncbi:MAG: DUF4449 domain-containing protein [Armatimonadetes bacterium]|jgi:hypothetical protein|nr:DUF4449 domain-containing protein [Armatimonadota bacterium]